MKKSILLISVVSCLGQALSGQFTFAPDLYIGAAPTNNNYVGLDRIGDAGVFEISGFRTDQDTDADTLTVSIKSTYFDNSQSGTSLLGTALGDLFISSTGLSWDTTAETLNDSFAIPGSTKWDFGIDLPETFSQAGLASVYSITDDNILLSNDVLEPTNNIYRADQEVALTGLQPNQAVSTAEWSFSFDDPNEGVLSMTINNVSSLFGAGNTLGFHWTMTCANDVIEFEHVILTPVPEPATLGLLGGFGLIGYLFIRRRFKTRQ